MSGRISGDQPSLLPDSDPMDWMMLDQPEASHNGNADIDMFFAHQSHQQRNFAHDVQASQQTTLAQSMRYRNDLNNITMSTLSTPGACDTAQPVLQDEFGFDFFDLDKYLNEDNGSTVDHELSATTNSPEDLHGEHGTDECMANFANDMFSGSLDFSAQNQTSSSMISAPYVYPEWHAGPSPGNFPVPPVRGQQQLNSGIFQSTALGPSSRKGNGHETEATSAIGSPRMLGFTGTTHGGSSTVHKISNPEIQIATAPVPCQGRQHSMEQAVQASQSLDTAGEVMRRQANGECIDKVQPNDKISGNGQVHLQLPFELLLSSAIVNVNDDTRNPISSGDDSIEAKMADADTIVAPRIKEEDDLSQSSNAATLQVTSLEEAASLMRRRAPLTLLTEDDRDDVEANQSMWVLKLAAAMSSKWREIPEDPKVDDAGWRKWQQSHFQKFRCLPKGVKPEPKHFQGAAWILLATVIDAHTHGPRINHPSGAENPRTDLTCSQRLTELVSVLAEYPIIRCDVIQLERLEELVANPRGVARQKIKYLVSNSRRDGKIQEKKRQPIDGDNDEQHSKRRKGVNRAIVARSTDSEIKAKEPIDDETTTVVNRSVLPMHDGESGTMTGYGRGGF